LTGFRLRKAGPPAPQGTPSSRRLSTVLTLTCTGLVFVSLAAVLASLFLHFGRRVEAAFHEKLRAEKDQVEILLTHRRNQLQERAKQLAEDNIVRVTLLLRDRPRLGHRILQAFPSEEGARCQVEMEVDRESAVALIPAAGPGALPAGAGPGPGTSGPIWRFSAPILKGSRRMGTAVVEYHMGQDRRLLEALRKATTAILLFRSEGGLAPVDPSLSGPGREPIPVSAALGTDFLTLPDGRLLGGFGDFRDLKLLASREALLEDQRRIRFWLGLFSLMVLAMAAALTIGVGRRLTAPLEDMAEKALRISEGDKHITFLEIINNVIEMPVLNHVVFQDHQSRMIPRPHRFLSDKLFRKVVIKVREIHVKDKY